MSTEEIKTIWTEEGLDELMMSAKDALANFKAFPEASEDISLAMKRGTANIYGQRRALIAIRTEWRTTHAELIEVGRAMQAVGAIGKTLMSMFQAHTLAQMRLADATRDLESATGKTGILREEMFRLERDGKRGTEEYIDTQMRLVDAENSAADAHANLGRVQQENIFGYASMGLSVIGVVGNLIDLAYHIKIIQHLHQAAKLAADLEAASHVTNAAAIAGESTAKAAAIGTGAAEATARKGWIATIWAEVVARVSQLSVIPIWGWAMIAAGTAIAAGAIGWYMSQRSYEKGGVIPETGWYYMHRRETVTPEGKAARGGVVINFSPVIYGDSPTRERAYDEFIQRMRRQGAL